MPRMTIFRSKSLVLILWMAAAAFPAAAVAQTPQTHTVKPGDTLWDLARQYMGDPFLWPEIYRLNTLVVEDPHWIFPGEVLRLSGGEAVSAVPTTDTPAPEPTVAPAPGEAQVAAEPVPAGQSAAEVPAAQQDLVQVAEPQEIEQAQAVQSDSVDMTPLFGVSRRRVDGADLTSAVSRAYRPLRRSEFYSSGFLSEGQALALGSLLGQVTPSQISSVTNRSTSHLYSKVALTPPKGGTYQVGDTLLVLRLDRKLDHYGEVVIPTGMIRVLDVSRKENTGEVIAEFGAIRNGNLTMPIEPFTDPGNVRAVPISDGVQGEVITSREPQELKGPQDVLFIDKGRSDGVAAGDLFEARRTAAVREDAPPTVPEIMATMQVVHVREHTATVRLLTVMAPDIPSGTRVRQVAKLPS